MSEVSVEQKLKVVQQIREEHSRNQKLIRGRESVLYGFHSPYPIYSEERIDTGMDSEPLSFSLKKSSLKIRIILAICLFVSVVLLDREQIPFFHYSVSDMFTYLETDLTKDFQANLFDFK